jgi:starch synthase (maltosyl-transferring)
MTSFLAEIGGMTGAVEADITALTPGAVEADITALTPGEVRVVSLEATAPVSLPSDAERTVKAAIKAPRIAIEAIAPVVENGLFPVKRRVGEFVEVSVDLISDGHDSLGASLLWRPADETAWSEVALAHQGNDRWAASFFLQRTGRYVFTVEAWVDAFATYREELEKKQAAGLSLDLEVQEGCGLIARLSERGKSAKMRALLQRLESGRAAPCRAAGRRNRQSDGRCGHA